MRDESNSKASGDEDMQDESNSKAGGDDVGEDDEDEDDDEYYDEDEESVSLFVGVVKWEFSMEASLLLKKKLSRRSLRLKRGRRGS